MSNKRYAEEHIWRPIAEKPELLGYPGAAALNHVQLGNQSGYIDLILLPPQGPKKLVLVEAKSARDRRSSADVIGQLLKYYAHALDLTATSLEAFKRAAVSASGVGRDSRLLSFKQVFGADTLRKAQEKAMVGARLEPQDLHLLVALDQDARKFEPRLLKVAAVLSDRHQVPIGVVTVSGGHVTWRYSSGH